MYTEQELVFGFFVISMIIVLSMFLSKNSIHMAIAMVFGVICGISAIAEPAIYRATHSPAEYQQAIDAKQAYINAKQHDEKNNEVGLSDNANNNGTYASPTVVNVAPKSSHKKHHKAHAVTQDQNQAGSEPSQPSTNNDVNKISTDAESPKPNTASTSDDDLRI